ncbi:hypothetical protein DH2020_045790 [Rehmannia glutinosa]|uniref:Protein kinase domain-containing protein n=1 Tax=Rehmannia glutinosa TaxID=99300 RepID=A0ABR0UD62_REHGL
MSISSLSIYLDLSYNALFGSVPSEVGLLRDLSDLDLSHNRLSGIFPNTISGCISLQRLHLDGNSFTGEIPQGLSVLRGLQDLDLSRNNFSGLIPSFLDELHLLNLNLSFNRLQGPVPLDGVFRNTSAISLQGNNELCGGILELKLPYCPSITKKKSSNILLKVLIPAVVLFIAVLVLSFILIQKKTKSRNNLYDSSFESQFKKLSYADLLKATDGFSEANVIGSGRFSTVYKGVLEDGPSETVVAVKVLKLNIRGAQKSFLSECNALRGARHRNLLKILSISLSIDFRGNDFTALIYQFKANGSLENWLHLNENMDRYLTLMQRLNIAIDVACAVEYLHSGTGSDIIVHGDLKPSNILLDDDMTAHVGDFGLAKVMSNIPSGFAAGESSSIAVRGPLAILHQLV